MRALFSNLVLVVALSLLVGCGGDDDKKQSPPAPPQQGGGYGQGGYYDDGGSCDYDDYDCDGYSCSSGYSCRRW